MKERNSILLPTVKSQHFRTKEKRNIRNVSTSNKRIKKEKKLFNSIIVLVVDPMAVSGKRRQKIIYLSKRDIPSFFFPTQSPPKDEKEAAAM